MNMTTTSSPSSSSDTDESGGPEPPGLPFAPAPVIELPHRWDESGKLLPGTSPSECPTCHWNGDLESFWDRGRDTVLTGEDIMRGPIKCASCELFRCILFRTAEMEGKKVTNKSFFVWEGFHVQTNFGGDYLENAYHSVFVSSDTVKIDIERYKVPSRFILSNEKLDHRASQWAQERLQGCQSSHELCTSQCGDPFLPTRLINLQPGWSGLDVRLENSRSVRLGSPYVALSYCWGGHKPACITTAETLAQNQKKIPWSKLPATFQDAAAFTLSLGVQYLWIDSVCIIQEDEVDWQREAGNMYAVYKNSYLTLAALSGSASTCGLRDMSIEQDSHLLADLRIAQNVYPLYIRRAHFLDNLWPFEVMKNLQRKALASRYPLLRRAWAYQERIVSRRVMYFTESEMIFQCLENAEWECGSAREWCRRKKVHPSNNLKTRIFLQTESDSLKMKGKEIVPLRTRDDICVEDSRDWQIASDWRSFLVREYSLLDISMPRDRLPALGAIAEQFKRVRPGEAYLAGLWSRSLLDDLLWVCFADQESLKTSKAKQEARFSVPTWSWASLPFSIGYYYSGVSVPKAEVIEAKCSYVGENEVGVLQSSKLVLQGRILESILKWTDDQYFPWSFCLRDGDAWTEFADKRGSNLRIHMDVGREGFQRIPPCQEISILEISEFTQGDTEWSSVDWLFLLLRRDSRDGFVYTRAGIAILQGRRTGDLNSVYEEHRHGFERAFEARSILTTCEIR